MALTTTQIRNAKPSPNGKPNKLGDGFGLYCIVTKTSKTWVYRYKRPNGKETIATFGKFPDMTLQQAREARFSARKMLTEGIDPNTNQKEKKLSAQNTNTPTFKDMFNQWYNNNKDNWKPNYQSDIVRRCERHIFPHIGNKPISGIDIREMIKVFQVLSDAGTIDTLDKVKGVSSRVFKYAVGMGIIDSDPTRDISADLFKKKKTKHLAHITDPKEIGGLLRMIDEYKGSYQVENALKIAPYVFLRPNELAGLEWKEVDFDNNIIRIDPMRMKMKTTHLVPLCGQVLEILNSLKLIENNSKYVFPGDRSNTRHMSPESLRSGLRRLGVSKEEMTTHG
ncbi:MAG: integrase arm-type DNA-binding domain-containing protein, partial [Candidatus Marinimicrobia bacterium]|nr:integrase arm-type DNA-binding domain-containing protein [Candidatus Neomarinimicrobiota bacterium]